MARVLLTVLLLAAIYLSAVRCFSELVIAVDSSSLWTSPSPAGSYTPEALPLILKRLSMLDPLSSAYKTLLARSLSATDDPDTDRSVRGAVRVDAINSEAWVLWGEVEGKHGRIDEGFASCERAVSLNPYRPETYLRTGLYLSSLLPEIPGQKRVLYRNLAELNLNLGLALDPSLALDPRLCLALGSIAAEKGDTSRAVFWLKRTVIQPPVDWPFALRKLALCFALGERVEAISTWKKVFVDVRLSPLAIGVIEAEAKKSSLPDFNYLLAGLHARAGRFDLAREELSSLVVARPNVADYRLALGDVYERQGRRRDAILCYEKALELSPANQEAKGKVMEYYRKGR